MRVGLSRIYYKEQGQEAYFERVIDADLAGRRTRPGPVTICKDTCRRDMLIGNRRR